MADLSSYRKRLEAAKAAGDWVTVGHLRELHKHVTLHLKLADEAELRVARMGELRDLIKQAQGA